MKKGLTVIVLLAIAMLLLSGCGGKEKKVESLPAAMAVVVANTSNSAPLNLSSTLLEDSVKEVVSSQGDLAIINCDGGPSCVFSQSYRLEENKQNASKQRLNLEFSNKTGEFLEGLTTVAANDPEVDFLESLRLASKAVFGGEGEKTILVIGSGVGTSGLLNLQNNILSAEAEDVVAMLGEKDALIDFTNTTVVWQQLGEVDGLQPKLTNAQYNKLAKLYECLVVAGGGEFVLSQAVTIEESNSSPAELPPVSVVNLPAEDPITFTAKTETPLDFSLPTSLEIKFAEDRATCLEPDAAEDTLEAIALKLKDSDIKLLIAGCTAGDSQSDWALELSEARANAVKDSLINLGVAAEKLVAMGLGTDNPWHIAGAGTSGPLAESNRKVVLIDITSDTAKDILKN